VNQPIVGAPKDRAALDRLLGELRPKLHRYCARMTGSVIDGEDVVQEALVEALEAFPQAGSIVHLYGWLFRIAHNASLDFLRRRARQDAARSDEDPDTIVGSVTATEDRQLATASLRTFMRLPHPDGRARLLAGRDRRHHGLQHSGHSPPNYRSASRSPRSPISPTSSTSRCRNSSRLSSRR
jgi:RNA polymerase sigma factor (sigma-70 family)